MSDIEAIFQIFLVFFKNNLIPIYFIFGSIAIFLMIIFVDKILHSIPNKKKTKFTENDEEFEIKKGIQSLDQALHDKVINEEEYEKFKADLIDKPHQ